MENNVTTEKGTGPKKFTPLGRKEALKQIKAIVTENPGLKYEQIAARLNATTITHPNGEWSKQRLANFLNYHGFNGKRQKAEAYRAKKAAAGVVATAGRAAVTVSVAAGGGQGRARPGNKAEDETYFVIEAVMATDMPRQYKLMVIRQALAGLQVHG